MYAYKKVHKNFSSDLRRNSESQVYKIKSNKEILEFKNTRHSSSNSIQETQSTGTYNKVY